MLFITVKVCNKNVVLYSSNTHTTIQNFHIKTLTHSISILKTRLFYILLLFFPCVYSFPFSYIFLSLVHRRRQLHTLTTHGFQLSIQNTCNNTKYYYSCCCCCCCYCISCFCVLYNQRLFSVFLNTYIHPMLFSLLLLLFFSTCMGSMIK